jgi:predicted DNA binding CopG/RHH family protein
MTKTHRLQIRLSENEFLKLKAKADAKGEPMAEIIRQYIHRLPNPKTTVKS